ncbi:MAG: type II and III secretion system protein [Lentisphaerae bacterium]|nr:type II and III secretion system protein [Lentisphaerota bacterium]
MKTGFAFVCCLIGAGIAAAGSSIESPPTVIEVEVRFIEFQDMQQRQSGVAWDFDAIATNSLTVCLDPKDTAKLLATLARYGGANLLSAPRLRTQSEKAGTVKVVREIRYPTGIDICPVVMTNGDTVLRGVAIVPGNFETRDVGITLKVTPIFDAQRNMIDLELTVEVVESEPIWKDYTATYEGADGTRRKAAISQPIFHTRAINTTISLSNNSTVVMGGLSTSEKKHIEDKVPILGAIPWLGRLFRSTSIVDEKRHLLIVISAKVVGETK